MTRWHRASYRRSGRLLPTGAKGLRAGSVILRPGGMMPWHSTGAREELLIALAGRAWIELQASAPMIRRVLLPAGSCVFLPTETLHRVVNRARTAARYLYVTAPTNT